MKVFAIQVSYFRGFDLMVCADDADAALKIADVHAGGHPRIADQPYKLEVLQERVRRDELAQYGWGENCAPLGLDGKTTLGEFLK